MNEFIVNSTHYVSSNREEFSHNTHPNSGAAVKCKGFDLSIFQKHLQHIWYQKQRVVFKHGLKI